MISRRGLLKGLGGLSLALPLLQIPGGKARAAAPYPKRFLVFFNPNGTLKELWSPQGGTETDFELAPLMAPLQRHKDQLLILDGIDLQVTESRLAPHNRGMTVLLTGEVVLPGDFSDGDGQTSGWAGGISLDQYIARELRPDTKLGTLELGVRAIENEPRSRLSYLGPDRPVPPQNDPVQVWGRLFENLGVDPATLARVVQQRRSVLDVVGQDFTALQRRLAPEDRQKLAQHFDAVRQLEQRLDLTVQDGSLCAAPRRPEEVDALSESEFARVARLHIDMLVMALSCDLVRVGSLQMSSAVNALRFTFMDLRQYDGHSLSHGAGGNDTMRQQWVQMNLWYAEQLAYLLDGLKAVPEGEGTMLDNTIVLWCNELSRGDTHSHEDMPFLLAGGGGGALRQGRHLRFDHEPHNNLLLGIAQAMGVQTEVFGNPDYCTRSLPGLT